MQLKIALAGNPNCGKTTLFNDLTGSAQYVGNWPGVTVERKEGRLRGHKDVVIQDLPGVYSLSPYTLEEVVTRQYLVQDKPDAIINIVDGTNIERNLYLTTQLLELGIPVVLAVNMMDLVRKSGDQLDLKKLSSMLGCSVMELSALKGEGCLEVAEKAAALAQESQLRELPHVFTGSVEHALAHIEESIETQVEARTLRWYAIKLFERDEKIAEQLKLSDELTAHLAVHIADCEAEIDDDAESIITNQRYTYISKIVGETVKKKKAPHSLSISDKIDRIVTNRVLALPIFAAIMFLVYYISISTIGGVVTDWTNDTLFGDMICGNLQNWMQNIGMQDWFTSLVVDGIVGGVGAVIGFVPQMVILFLLLSVLEDVGYMARVAFIMDRIFRKVGLSGKSFIPMLVASGCGVPGIMASRTIENERDRRMTIMTTGFIPCGAKMPIVALFAGALFGGSGLIATSAYFVGVAAVIISGVLLKKTRLFAGEPAPFVMELPQYHVPSVTNVLRSTWDRALGFVLRAGTVILLSAIILWFLQSFGWNGGLYMVEDNNTSLLAAIGSLIAPIFAPLGFGTWKATVATFTGLIAKENVVGTFGVLYGFADVGDDASVIWANLSADFTQLTAYSFMLFNLLCAPCFAAMGAIKREMNSTKWTWIAIGYMCGFAYVASLIVNQLGRLVMGESFGVGTAVAFLVLIGYVYLLLRKNKYVERQNSTASLRATSHI